MATSSGGIRPGRCGSALLARVVVEQETADRKCSVRTFLAGVSFQAISAINGDTGGVRRTEACRVQKHSGAVILPLTVREARSRKVASNPSRRSPPEGSGDAAAKAASGRRPARQGRGDRYDVEQHRPPSRRCRCRQLLLPLPLLESRCRSPCRWRIEGAEASPLRA